MINEMGGNGGRVLRSHILISVRCLLDLDYGLVKYCAQELPNKKLFNLEKFYDVAFLDLVNELYSRDYWNPLYYLAYPGVDRTFLDNLYHEIMEEREEKVLEYCISTEIANVMEVWSNDKEIASIDIFCYTEKEKKVLEEDPSFSKYNIITSVEAAMKTCEQFFFLAVDEASLFKDLQFSSIYFSRRRLNFVITENGDYNIDPDNEDIRQLIMNKNDICIFDLYRDEIIRRNSEDEGF